MARSTGNEIPEAIRPLFAGADLEAHEGLTFLLLTTTADGWPHLAMISVGEVISVGARDLRMALWRGSTAAGNLARDGRATLALVHDGAGYSLRCSGRQGLDLPIEHGRLSYFELRVDEALEDVAPYAVLTSGITFRLKEPADVLPRWRETVTALRER
jgi:hypothetical protein